MEGFLDHLEGSSHPLTALVHKKAWVRRFFRINEAFHLLEFFTDASQLERCGKISLRGAQVASANDLGALLTSPVSSRLLPGTSSKLPIENARRFVIRVTEPTRPGAHPGSVRHHYLCAEEPVPCDGSLTGATTRETTAASRESHDRWIRALLTVIAKVGASSAGSGFSSASDDVTPIDLRELNAKIAGYMDELHVSAHVTSRHEGEGSAGGKGVYEVTAHAWILHRELVPMDETDSDSDGDSDDYDTVHDRGRGRGRGRGLTASNRRDGSSNEWQVLEYACTWSITKRATQWKDFDAQLRHFFRDQLRDVTLPSVSGLHSLLHHHRGEQTENQRRVALYDAYLQQLLCLPVFSVFGGDGSTMLDQFLELSPHLSSLRKIEKTTGQNLKLRNKRVVPWSERERFVQLYRLHVEMMEAKAQQQRQTKIKESARKQRKYREISAHDRGREHRHHHHHHRDEPRLPDSTIPMDQVLTASPAPVGLTEDETEAARLLAVQQRIARIGRKIIGEAFQVGERPHSGVVEP